MISSQCPQVSTISTLCMHDVSSAGVTGNVHFNCAATAQRDFLRHIVVLFSRAPVRTLVPLVLASERLLSILSYVRCDARDDISRIRTYQPGCADTSLPIHDRMFYNVFQLGLLISRTIQLRCSRCLILRLKIPSLCLDVYSAYLRDMYSLS